MSTDTLTDPETVTDGSTANVDPFVGLDGFEPVPVPVGESENEWVKPASKLSIGGQALRKRISDTAITDDDRKAVVAKILAAGRVLGDRTVRSQVDSETDDNGTVTGVFVTMWAVPKRGKAKSS